MFPRPPERSWEPQQLVALRGRDHTPILVLPWVYGAGLRASGDRENLVSRATLPRLYFHDGQTFKFYILSICMKIIFFSLICLYGRQKNSFRALILGGCDQSSHWFSRWTTEPTYSPKKSICWGLDSISLAPSIKFGSATSLKYTSLLIPDNAEFLHSFWPSFYISHQVLYFFLYRIYISIRLCRITWHFLWHCKEISTNISSLSACCFYELPSQSVLQQQIKEFGEIQKLTE